MRALLSVLKVLVIGAVTVVLLAVKEVFMQWIESLAVNLILGILSATIKNPKSVSIEASVIQHIRDDATLALASVNPTAPPPPGFVAAPTA